MKDQIGGMTAAHRSVLGRHIFVLQQLIAAGASLDVKDKDGRTPLDLITIGLKASGDSRSGKSGLCYAWGVGSNYQLGQGSAGLSVKRPSRVGELPAAAVCVATSKLHSIVVLRDGAAWSSGFGAGGRLGHGDEEAAPLFKPIRALSQIKVRLPPSRLPLCAPRAGPGGSAVASPAVAAAFPARDAPPPPPARTFGAGSPLRRRASLGRRG